MPRLNRPPKYRKHKASGQAVVTLGGVDHYLGPHGTKASRREYDRLIGEWLISGGVTATAESITVAELLVAFLKHAEKHHGKESRETLHYKTLAKRLRKTYGHTPVSEFGPLRLKAFRETLIEGELSRGVVNQTINRVRRIFRWGTENELVRPDILHALKAVAGLRYGKSEARETEPIRPVPDAFVDATLDHCCPQVAAMIELQRLTGMRSGEVTIMRTADINTSGVVWTYTPAEHKTKYRGHTRVVYLGPKAQAVVKPWLRPDLEAYLFSPREAESWRREQQHVKRKTPLSCGNRPGTNRKKKPRKQAGERYDSNSYHGAIKYAQKKLNAAREKTGELPIPHWHPHQLRHNHATLVRREHGIEVARVLLGHKHAAITEVYAEADHARAIEVAGKIG
jgi:integrase